MTDSAETISLFRLPDELIARTYELSDDYGSEPSRPTGTQSTNAYVCRALAEHTRKSRYAQLCTKGHDKQVGFARMISHVPDRGAEIQRLHVLLDTDLHFDLPLQAARPGWLSPTYIFDLAGMWGNFTKLRSLKIDEVGFWTHSLFYQCERGLSLPCLTRLRIESTFVFEGWTGL